VTPNSAASRVAARRIVAVGAAVAAATLVVHGLSLVVPGLQLDDFMILRQSRSWADTRERLWVPVNEHCWPLFRLLTCGVMWAADGAASLPLAGAVSVRVALLGTVWFVYRFVRQERGHPYYGLAAAAGFGVTTAYQEAVNWYAASPALWAAAATLLALLAAQRWVQARSWVGLAATAVWSAVAPGWFGGGVLTGPLCALYLFLSGRWWVSGLPLVGTVVFVALALAMAGDQLLHVNHHGSDSTIAGMDPVVGAVYTARSVVDNLLFGAVGVAGFTTPPAVAAVLLVGVAAGAGWWWRRAPRRDLVVLGLAFIILHFGLIYSARAGWSYDQLRGWSRYTVFPWLGVVLAVAGGLRRPADTELTARQAWRLGLLILGLMLVNLPRGILGTPIRPEEQPRVLRQVDEVDRKCREAGVPAEAAWRVLTPLPMPGDPAFDAYLLIHGGTGPADVPDDEVRARLGLR